MRTGQPIIGRPAWYDRNPSQRGTYDLQLAIAPHSATERVTYTVPAGKKAMVESIEIWARRVSAATTLGTVEVNIRLLPGGGAPIILLLDRFADNTVDKKVSQLLAASFMLLPTDVLKGYTSDSSTGGTADYFIAVKITEFDA